MLAVLLAVTFAAWCRSEHTLSIHSIVTTRREGFYWLAILVTFALGTAIGDLVAEKFNLGYGVTVLLFACTIALVVIARFGFGANAVLTFWLAYVLTRPLGASIGDLVSQSREHGRLGLGRNGTGALFLGAILVLVGFLTLTRVDRTEVVPREQDEALAA
jgi:uncharacterized membrane-anchored protein